MKKTYTQSIILIILSMLSFAYGEALFENIPFYQGMNGYHTYRIPALYQTQSGVLLAFAEGRKNGTSDTGDIDTVLRRSFDGGYTWQDMQVVWSDGANTCGNPTVVQDQTNGRIWLFMTHNLGSDTQSAIQNGTSDGIRTIWSCFSDNDGASWSSPVNMFNQVQPSDTRWDATGPGRGIQLKSGNNPGRLIIPALGRNIQSDNNGQSWSQSSWLMQGSPHPQAGNSESQIVEVQAGVLLRNDRRVGGPGGRLFTKSYNQGANWASSQYRLDLPCPRCMGSTIAVDTDKGFFGRKLVFSNPSSAENRENMKVQYSYDDGTSWTYGRTVYPGASAYSCLSPIGENYFGLLYENGDSYSSAVQLYRRITFAKFHKDWIRDKAVATWDFEQFAIGQNIPTTAGAVKDKRGYGLDATADVAFEVVEGGIGKNSAARFIGGGNGIRISNNDTRGRVNFGADESFTLRVIFKSSSHCSGGVAGAGALIAKDVGPNTKSWWLRIQDGRLRFFLCDGPSSAQVWSSSTVCDGRWYEVLAVRDAQANQLRMYVNGKLEGQSNDNTAEGFENNNPVSIGCFNTGASSFVGDISLAQIYLTTEENIITLFDGDLDLNRVVDVNDLKIMGFNWLNTDQPSYSEGDLNADGVVDIYDFSVISANWLLEGY